MVLSLESGDSLVAINGDRTDYSPILYPRERFNDIKIKLDTLCCRCE
jgi:hypothetical protein